MSMTLDCWKNSSQGAKVVPMTATVNRIAEPASHCQALWMRSPPQAATEPVLAVFSVAVSVSGGFLIL